MGFYLGDILPCREFEDYPRFLKMLSKVKRGKTLTKADKTSLQEVTQIFEDVVELWDKEG